MNSNFYISLNDCDEFFNSYFVMTAVSMSYFGNVAIVRTLSLKDQN